MASLPASQSPPFSPPPDTGWHFPPLLPAPPKLPQSPSQSVQPAQFPQPAPRSQYLPSIGSLLSPTEPYQPYSFSPATSPKDDSSILQLQSPYSPTLMAKRRARSPATSRAAVQLQSLQSPTSMDKQAAPAKEVFAHRKQMAAAFLPSPPNSSETPIHHSFSSAQDEGTSDPQLYRARTPSTPIADRPLFATDEVLKSQISAHMTATAEKFKIAPVSPPKPQDYLAVAQVFNMVRTTGVKTYMDREWGWMQIVGKPQPQRKILQDSTPNRRQLKPLAPKTAIEARKRHPATVPPRSPRAPRKSGVRTPQFNFEDGSSPPPRRRAATIKPKIDYDYKTIPDFAPAEHTMDQAELHARQVKWNGASSTVDLSNDPERHLLSRAELEVAEKLRLPCARFLVQKRKIFQLVIDTLRKGKEFKKTNCQQCGLIDVNKLSTIWVFYNGVGWFKPEHYTSYLKMSEDEWLKIRDGIVAV